MPHYYPVHLDLAGKLCVVVGGGPVAERKVCGLLESGARVRVVCIEATRKLRQLAAEGSIELLCASYNPSYLDGASLVFAVTDQRRINEEIAADARAVNVLINRADAFASGDFIVPAVVRNGDLCLSVSTGGHQPLLTSRIAEELTGRFGPDYGEFVALLGKMREEIKARFGAPAAQRSAMKALILAELPLRSLLQSGDAVTALAEARRIVDDLDASSAA